ncbi:MAG TPA: hypothetical protein VD993_17865 [Chitinophagaceae bacterium]|nr:hypothetical protein [Chitinophagaceae bacterium]
MKPLLTQHVASVLLLIFTACSDTTTTKNQEDDQTAMPAADSSATKITTPEFAIKVGGRYLQLSQWDRETALLPRLGAPLSEKVDTLGAGADTFMGSRTKTQVYDGLIVKWFSPKASDSFWVQEIAVKSEKFETAAGLKVGDDVKRLQLIYPKAVPAKITPGEYYTYSDETQTKNLEIEIKNSKVIGYRFFYLMN